MATLNKSVTFQNAVIDANAMTITEETKNGEKTYSIKTLLEEWDGVVGVSLSIKQRGDIPEDVVEYG